MVVPRAAFLVREIGDAPVNAGLSDVEAKRKN